MRARSHRWKRLYSEPLEDRVLLAADILQESGSFVDEVERLKQLAFGKESNAYVTPSSSERAAFSGIATHLINGDVQAAAEDAADVGYEVVEFSDVATGLTLVGLREELVAGFPTRGWGSYFVNQEFETNVLVEVPHPISDINTWEIGTNAFMQASSRGLLIAGAHRNANGLGTADVSHLADSIFDTVHEAWNDPGIGTTVLQLHGFNLDNHDADEGHDAVEGEGAFPAGTDVVLSATDGTVSPLMLEMDAAFEGGSFQSYAFNTLAPGDPTNLQINDGVDGGRFSSLAGTTNAQAGFTRTHGGQFLHVELEQRIRFDSTNRISSAAQIADAIRGLDEPTKFYVVDASDDRTYEYGVTGSENDSYDLAKGNSAPRGAAADASGLAVWVIDNDDMVYVYDDAGTLLGNWQVDGVARPEGIATDGTDIWIVDRGKERVHYFPDAAANRSGSASPASSFSLASGNRNARGITTDGSYLWVVNSRRVVDEVFKYTVTGDLVGSWALDEENKSPRGITVDPSNPDHLWVVDNKRDAVFQYLNGGQRVSGAQSADAVFAHLGSNPQGIADPPPPVDGGSRRRFGTLPSRIETRAGIAPPLTEVVARTDREGLESVGVRASFYLHQHETGVDRSEQSSLLPAQSLALRSISRQALPRQTSFDGSGGSGVGSYRAISQAKASIPTDDEMHPLGVVWDSLEPGI